ncbi:MAG: NADH-quinone oxidoreductase subunit L [Planctomycetaceae bacterium]|nr:NADH-quinone oxidoreductase subunit L [Planctomycetaceae bacterium]
MQTFLQFMLDIKTLLILIPALPLVAAVLTAALGAPILRTRSHLPVVAAIALSSVASLLLLARMQEQAGQGRGGQETVSLWRWADVAGDGQNAARQEALSPGHSLSRDFRVDVALEADSLTAAMLAIVTCISTLVAIYSIGYMRGDLGYWRFFSYIGLFVFSMTMLVSATNLVLLYVFWEAVGLCSYLLIGFWYERPAAADAGKKAFLVNRIGDVGLALGIFLIWTTYGTVDFREVFAAAGNSAGDWRTTVICLLLLAGACGKSAQVPLHVWLPDAMEGPTPVSALIHAATMVTAGVYLIARCMPLFATSVTAQCAVATVGGVTALLGGIIAVTQTDLKRILAYSTISHLGYMFLALGTGTLLGVTAGMFHLLTHAFFKALLFLAAGSVMHAMGGVIDIRRLGGLRRRMPVTHWTFLVGCLAIAGVWPLSGFWSKDAIVLAVQQRYGSGAASTLFEALFVTATFGVLLIDFYMFRPYFLVFWGKERIPAVAGGHAQESPRVMTAPLIALALGAAGVGAYFAWTGSFARFLAGSPSLAGLGPAMGELPRSGHESIALLSTAITLVGIVLAAFIYLGGPQRAARLARAMNVIGLYSLSYGKFFFDPLYHALVVWPLLGAARLAAWFDRRVIDGLVDLFGWLPALVGAALRPVQGGLVQFYALAMMLGLLAMLGLLLM